MMNRLLEFLQTVGYGFVEIEENIYLIEKNIRLQSFSSLDEIDLYGRIPYFIYNCSVEDNARYLTFVLEQFTESLENENIILYTDLKTNHVYNNYNKLSASNRRQIISFISTYFRLFYIDN